MSNDFVNFHKINNLRIYCSESAKSNAFALTLQEKIAKIKKQNFPIFYDRREYGGKER